MDLPDLNLAQTWLVIGLTALAAFPLWGSRMIDLKVKRDDYRSTRRK